MDIELLQESTQPLSLVQVREVKTRFGQNGVADGEILSSQRFEVRDRRSVLAVPRIAQRHERRGVEEDHRDFDRSFRTIARRAVLRS